jgi:hypothetical protein
MKIIKVLALIVLIALTLSMKNNHRRRTSNGPSWEIKKIDGLSENLFVEYRSGNAEQTKVLSLGEIYINGKPDTKSLCFEFPEDIMNNPQSPIPNKKVYNNYLIIFHKNYIIIHLKIIF